MVQNFIFLVFILGSTTFGFSQNTESFWDINHAATATVTIKAGESFVYQTEGLPMGTTEVLYRIKVVETNSKITESLISILKSIPDPTGISQGTAGVLFLTTTLTGKDKFDYAVFASLTDANLFVKTKKSTKSCFQSTESSSADSKILKSENSCFNLKTRNLYFVITNANWVLDQSVVIEIVPFVNKKLARGWNEDTKVEAINLAKTTSIFASVSNKNGFILHFKNYIEEKYTYPELQQLLAVEKLGLLNDATEFSLKKIGEEKLPLQLIRTAAERAVLNADYAKALTLFENEIVAKNKATIADWYSISLCYLATKQFDKAKNLLGQVTVTQFKEIKLQLALANYYLVINNWKDCKEIHEKFSNQNLDATTSWKQASLHVLDVLGKAGLENKNFKKLENFLKK